ncbi:trehalose-phosphatase [Halomarina rubra]|uniref:Trehalose 6-phosphate phosphatase n=1 Tax=Halomarina rubra TaxID=2071873 RepID=A0ABD6AU37_9EURY|nr:trehalose-phosphatase [Halomarina rubra]
MSERPPVADGSDDPANADVDTDPTTDTRDTSGAAATTDDAVTEPSGSDHPLRERIAAELRTHDHLVLCVDFDGTLAPIVSDPASAALRTGNRDRLERLRDHPAVTLAVVSGRGLADVRERVGVEDIHYAGNAGLERAVAGSDADDPIEVHEDARRAEPHLERARETLRDRLGWAAGVSVEDKRWSLAVHTRNAPDTHERVAETVGRVVERVGGLHVSEGHQVFEVGPATDVNKGAAVSALADEHAERHDADPLVMYVGDDRSDRSAFGVAADRGVAVYVGADGPDEAHHVADPTVVSDLLDWLVTTGLVPSASE